MSSRIIWLCVLLVAVVAAGGWLHMREDARPAALPPSDLPAAATASPRASGSIELRAGALVSATAPGAGAASAKPAGTVRLAELGLQIDGQGHLVKDAQTRDELERVLDGDPAGIEIRRQEFVDSLPAAAAEEALDLLDRFVNYRAALREALPDVSGALTEQDALILLETTHNLRVAYFGDALAEAFFGAEEAIGRSTAEGILRAGSEVR